MDLSGDVPVARAADLDDVRVRGAGRARGVGGAAPAAHHQVTGPHDDDRDRRRLLARDARRLADALIRRRGTAHAAAAAALGGRFLEHEDVNEVRLVGRGKPRATEVQEVTLLKEVQGLDG